MENLQIEINKILQNLGIDSSLGIIQLSNRPELSDYQINGCFQIGKTLSKNPLDIANTIILEISESLKLEYSFTAVKPGFINITLKDKTLLKLVKNNLEIKPINQSVVIDYGSPNVAKGMHVGHLRSTLISNGSYLYHTTDLACIKTRTNYDKILYVVDNRQSLHFKQVFTVALKTGYIKPNQAFHVDFGTINGKDGKPFKTRDGEVLKLPEQRKG